MTTTTAFDWERMGKDLRQSAMDAHDGQLPRIDIAYSFLLDNPECFIDADVWPVDMPAEPPIELVYAYYSREQNDAPGASLSCGGPFQFGQVAVFSQVGAEPEPVEPPTSAELGYSDDDAVSRGHWDESACMGSREPDPQGWS